MSLVGPVEQEVLEPGQRSIPELVKSIHEEHLAGGRKAGEAITHWIAAGEALQAVRAQMGSSDEWEDWCADNLVDISRHFVTRYIRLARYRDVLYDAEKIPNDINVACSLLVGLPREERIDAAPAAIKERARELRNEGLTFKAIGEMFGYSDSTVYGWVDPRRGELMKEYKRKASERKNKARAAAKAQQESTRAKAIARAAKSRGGAAQKLYAICERLQDDIAQAHSEATDPEARRHYALMGEHYRKMRDEGVRALGVS